MGKVTFDISMSSDGLIAGPDDNAEQGLGEGGKRLHEWAYELASFHERLFDNVGGKPVELERIRVIDSPGVTHLKYRVVG